MAQDRELLRKDLDRQKELEYLSEVETERCRIGTQIEQLQRQIGQLTQKKVLLDQEWRTGILSVQAVQCRPTQAPSFGKKLNPGESAQATKKKSTKASGLSKALKGASLDKLNKLTEILKEAGIEL